MSLLNVNKVDPATGTGLELGSSGDTLTVPSGVTLDVASGATLDTTGATVTGISGGLVYTGGGATTTNVSAIAINGCFSATYRQYLVVYDITPDTNGSNPRINFRDTSNNNITPSKYGYADSWKRFWWW